MSFRLLSLTLVVLGAVLWIALVGPAAGAHASPGAQEREDYNSGAYLYRTFCASCHGERGRGDGPVADLSNPPASDITVLQQRAGGTFPRAEVRAILDGSKTIRGHDGNGMPDWNRVLRQTAGGDERLVQRRIDALVSHVEGLQGK